MKKIIAIAILLISTGLVSYGQEKLIPVQRDIKYGYAFSSDGPLILAAKYDDAKYFEEGLAPVRVDQKWGYINEQGVMVIPCKYDYAEIFVDGYASVGMNGTNGQYKYGIINKSGVLVVPMKYDGVGNIEEGLVSVQVGNKMGFINLKGVMVIPLKFDFTSGQMADFAGGYARVQVGKKFEYIDKTGKILTPAKYSAGADFKEGMAMVAVDTIWNKYTSDGSKITLAYGFINATGQEAVKCQYAYVTNFENGFAQAQVDGYTYKIDKTGKVTDTIAKPAPKRKLAIDSTTYTGKINKMGRLTLLYSQGFIQKITLNDMPVYNTSRSPIDIDAKKMGLKAGSSATLKVVYTKGTSVKFLTGQGLN